MRCVIGVAAAAVVGVATSAGFDSFSASAAVASCSEDLVAAAFYEGDVSQARAELAVYKDGSKAQRECAANAWKRGVESVVQRQSQAGGSRLESRVLARFGGDRCGVRVEDGSWLDVPRLQEVLVCIHINNQTIVLEQDGFLRPFDMATVLWPAGFFLTHWVWRHCQMLSGRILELGTGLGAPSIAASLCGGSMVMATDKEPFGLVNVRTNADINGATVLTQVLDWRENADIGSVAAHGWFDFVLGAGLSPRRWGEREWTMLHGLLRPRIGKIVLCQGTGEIDGAGGSLGNGTFIVEQVIPGDEYGLQTRWGTPSEFELIILRPAGFDEL